MVDYLVCDKKVNGGAFNHFENGVLLQKIQDIMFIVITKNLTNSLLN
jgi:hypothetical protein